MAEITNTISVAETIGRWNPADLAYIEKLEYQSDTEQSSANIVLVGLMQRRDQVKGGWPSNTSPRFRVTILFGGIRNLELKGFGPNPKQIMGFNIIDVSDDGLEGISFMIEDYEDGDIQFYCRTVDIINVVPI